MLDVKNRRVKKQYVIGGSGIMDTFLQFLVKKFTSQAAKQVTKEIGKTALDAGKTVAVEAGKKLIEKAMKPAVPRLSKGERIKDIVLKYTGKSLAPVPKFVSEVSSIENIVRKLNPRSTSGSGLKLIPTS